MEIRPVGAELFHVDGRTDMTKLIVAFRNFSTAPTNNLLGTLNKEIMTVRCENDTEHVNILCRKM